MAGMENIAAAYQNKIFSIIGEFERHGLEYFSDNVRLVRQSIDCELLSLIEFTVEKLDQKLTLLNKIPFFCSTAILSTQVGLKWFLKEYQAALEIIREYEIEKNLSSTLCFQLERVNDETFRELKQQGIEVLTAFGLHNQTKEIESKTREENKQYKL